MFKEAISIQLESEAGRFAAMPVDHAGWFSAISVALRGMAIALSRPEKPDPDRLDIRPDLRLVKSD